MARFNSKSFAQSDLLKAINPRTLITLLSPCREFLQARGLSLPRDGGEEIDYLALAGILAQPDEWMDSNVVEGLHVIGNLGVDENFDELLDIARRNFIEVDIEATAADLAARIWVEAPQALELKERQIGAQRKRKFESFPAREPEKSVPIDQLPIQFEALEADLERWFTARNRGIGCRVVRRDLSGEVRFFVQHGQPCKREPSRKGAESTCTFFRPEKTDLVVYDPLHNELRISTSTLGELRLYREKFGAHVFGDPETFLFAQKYTLEPLRTDGTASLSCRDIGGLERVWLTELEYGWNLASDHTERHKADDVFRALAERGREIEERADLLRARFAVQLTGETNTRPVLIRPPNVAEYGRGEEAGVIEQWLRARGFVLVGSTVTHEAPHSFMALT